MCTERLDASVGPRQGRGQEAPRSPYRLWALVATEYCQAGFTTIVQDNIFGDDVMAWIEAVNVRPRHLVVLRPSVAVVLERDNARQWETGKVAYRAGETDIHQLEMLLEATPRVGLWLDTSTKDPAETVQCILERQSEAAIDAIT